MNREIKFRAWDKKNKRMINNDSLCFLNETFETDDHDNMFVLGDDLEIMQFTGLKDKNGVEIYEGDLLKVVDMKDDTIGMENNIYIVEYDRDQFCITTQIDGYHEIIPRENAIEVIGNIYENPELLKSK